ncbi:MAG: ABC transporter ATP-binding protein [Planctomycetes bacterium]|nr:ABC transporter ATP-binding protein [Planctomycetota bacterium]
METDCLVVEELFKAYATRGGGLEVLRGVSFRLGRGESIAIMGPSGCGKSTLLHILGTLEWPTSGRVLLAGRNPFELGEADLARFRNRHVGFVFQDHHLLPQCSVVENVLLPTLVNRDAGEDAPARARQILERVGLSGRLDHRPAELSGGERQRAAIARALINRPHLLLCDEPTGNLDRVSAETVGSLFLEVCAEEQAALVLVTHSLRLAERFARRMELVDGRLEG